MLFYSCEIENVSFFLICSNLPWIVTSLMSETFWAQYLYNEKVFIYLVVESHPRRGEKSICICVFFGGFFCYLVLNIIICKATKKILLMIKINKT